MKDIPGYEGRYEVSSLGRIRAFPSIRGHAGGMKSPYRQKKGHLAIDLYSGGKQTRKKAYVHRLVLEAFVGPCPNGMEGCHGDGNPANNSLQNLRWDTPSANWEDARKHGTARIRDTHHWTKLSSEDLLTIKKLKSEGLLQRQIAEKFNVCQQAISHALRKVA